MALQVLSAGVAEPASATVESRRRRGALLPFAAVGIALLLPLAVLLVTVVLMGWQLQVIATGSMAPRFPAGSLAVIEPLDPADVRAGMTIVFSDPGTPGRLVAHRAIKRLPGDGPLWQTKGDANTTVDPFPVPASSVHGRVRWAVPGLGRVASLLTGPIGPGVLVGGPITALVVTEVAAARRRRREATS